MTLLKNMYFVAKGQRTGQFLVLVDYDKEKQNYSVLGLPESETLYVTEIDIKKGIDTKLLDFVEELPTDVYESCKNEFQYRINHK